MLNSMNPLESLELVDITGLSNNSRGSVIEQAIGMSFLGRGDRK